MGSHIFDVHLKNGRERRLYLVKFVALITVNANQNQFIDGGDFEMIKDRCLLCPRSCFYEIAAAPLTQTAVSSMHLLVRNVRLDGPEPKRGPSWPAS